MILHGPSASRDVDRRRHMRQSLAATCKVLHHDAISFAAGRTEDVSASGCRFVSTSDRPFQVGEILRLGIASHPGTLLEAGSLLPCRVRRVRALDDGTREVAVEFDWAQSQSGTLGQAA